MQLVTQIKYQVKDYDKNFEEYVLDTFDTEEEAENYVTTLRVKEFLEKHSYDAGLVDIYPLLNLIVEQRKALVEILS